jgi:tetratricopeptide (TPR) repeat protein
VEKKFIFLFAVLLGCCFTSLEAANTLNEIKKIAAKEKYEASDIRQLNSFFASDSAMRLPGAERVLSKMQGSALQAKDSSNWAFSTLNFGVYFYEKGKYEGSIHHLMEVIRYFEKNRNDTAIANAYNQLARVYYNINQIQRNDIKIDPSNLPQLALRQLDVDKGENFARQAAAINKRLNRKAELASNYNNLGLIKQEKFELDSAEEYFRKAIALYESLGLLTKKAYTLNNLGILYENLFRADLELNAYQEALTIFEKLGDQQRIAIANINIAMVHFDGGNNKLALEYANKSLAIANRLNDLPVKKDVYFQLSVIYDAMLDCDKELFFFQRFIQVKDSLFDIESKRILEDVNAQYETEKKENQISLLNKEKELDSIIRNSLIAGFALLLILAFVLLRSYRQKQSANLLLTSQNAVIESERKKI